MTEDVIDQKYCDSYGNGATEKDHEDIEKIHLARYCGRCIGKELQLCAHNRLLPSRSACAARRSRRQKNTSIDTKAISTRTAATRSKLITTAPYLPVLGS